MFLKRLDKLSVLLNYKSMVHRKNEFREVFNKDPATKITSMEFAVFGPAKSEHSFRENLCP